MLKSLFVIFNVLILSCLVFLFFNSCYVQDNNTIYNVKIRHHYNSIKKKSQNHKTEAQQNRKPHNKVNKSSDVKSQLNEAAYDHGNKETTHDTNAHNLNCDFNSSSFNSNLNQDPLIKTDRAKYLLPVTHNGATNQIIGLREAIFLSIRMNRTLILPKFYKSFLDDSKGDKEIPARNRLDIVSLSNLIRFEFNSKIHDICKHGIEILLSGQTCEFIHRRRYLVEEVTRSITVRYPKTPVGRPDYICAKNRSDNSHLFRNYSKQKCIGFGFYLTERRVLANAVKKSKLILNNLKASQKTLNSSQLEDDTIYASIVLSTGLPFEVKNLAKKFVDEFFTGDKWLAIHWRYNPDDWLLHCKGTNLGGYKKLCAQLKVISPKDILHAGINAVKKYPNKIQTIYVATPTNQKTIIDGIETEYAQTKKRSKQQNKNSLLNVLTSKTLIKFLTTQNQYCGFHSLYDLIALVEMQICIESSVFFHSQRSSWSMNVIKQRVDKNKSNDGEIVSKAWEIHMEKN